MSARRNRSVSSLAAGALTLAAALATAGAHAASKPTCPRPAAGGAIAAPTDLYGKDGVLNVDLFYRTQVDADGRQLYCITTDGGIESPTLHVNPGDTLNVNFTNAVTADQVRRPPAMLMGVGPKVCAAKTQDATSANLHFHGTNVAPVCHSDEVVHTLVNSGESYGYSLKFPADEPPGLYWYHPHVHGIAEAAVLGGASGAIVVDGIENVQPAVAGLPARVLIVRDQTVAGNPKAGGKTPSWDVTLNYSPVAYPHPAPGTISVQPGVKEFWRVANAAADTVVDLSVKFDGVPQTLQLVGLDGVPTGSQDGSGQGKLVPVRHVLLAPGGRAEFILTTPTMAVHQAELDTDRIDTGPGGDNDTARTLAVITPSHAAMEPSALPSPSAKPGAARFAGLEAAPITARRRLHFSEVLSIPTDPNSPTNFYITVNGAKRQLFDPNNPPAIVTRQGAVEEWTIENRTGEVHEFHMHQIHFLLTKRNGQPAPPAERQFFDMIQVPYWSGTGPYPSVTLLMDFRGPVVGDFVYHCHILGHEDNGMMAIIRVLPKGG